MQRATERFPLNPRPPDAPCLGNARRSMPMHTIAAESRCPLQRRHVFAGLRAAAVYLCAALVSPFALYGALDPQGWTIVTASADTKVIHVSASEGDDGNDGLSPATAVKTLARGASLMRDGFPDHLLLRRGDVWTDESLGTTTNGRRFLNGRSADEPMVVSYYGQSGDRPLINCGLQHFVDHNGQARSHVSFIGLHLRTPRIDPDDPAYTGNNNDRRTMRFVGGGENILIEDCKLEMVELVAQSLSPNVYRNFRVRRSIFVDTWARGTSTNNNPRPSGMYAAGVDGLLVEESLFDHNGWNAQVADAGANQFCHNLYLQSDNIGNKVVVRGNIFTRGAATGVQGRPGGLYELNLFVENSVGLLLGRGASLDLPDTMSVASKNVILQGNRMNPSKGVSTLGSTAVWGLDIAEIIPGTFHVADNIVAHRKESGTNRGILSHPDVVYVDNIQYNWGGGIGDMFDPSWVDPDRSVDSYHGMLGAEPTLVAFIDQARARGLREWPFDYTAYAVIDYIAKGFNREFFDAIPDFTVPADLVVEATGPEGSIADFAIEAPSDAYHFPLSISTSHPSGSVFPLGVTQVTVTATDVFGNEGAKTFTITVVDTTAPEITSLAASPNKLWPPNRKMVQVTLSATVSDAVDDGPVTEIISVTSNEAVGGSPDWEITGLLALKLRAEREGSGNGRIYTITVRSTDDAGNSATATVEVAVPHDQSH